MSTVKEIYEYLNELADITLAEKWDNVGLMIGDYNSNVNNAMVCLDVTTDVVEEAIANDVNLIVSHHPLIFRPIKSLDFTSDFKANILKQLIKHDIAVISFHTNLDSAPLGLNDYLAKKLELKNISLLFENASNSKAGLGRIGELSDDLSFDDFIHYLKSKFNLETISAAIGDKKNIKTVAILGGSGGDFLYTLPEVDIYLTGDIGYHVALDAIEMKKNIIDIGHFSEHFVKDLLKEYLEKLPIKVIKATVEKTPFKII